jgi:hypothetical protein
MEKDHQKEIEAIIGQSKCPKDFLCYGSGFETLCKARLIDGVPFLECIEKGAHTLVNALSVSISPRS